MWYEAEAGSPEEVATRAKAYGVDWVAVKVGQYGPWPQAIAWAAELAQRMTVYGWGYHLGRVEEARIAHAALRAGLHGYIFDVEAEVERLPDAAAIAWEWVREARQEFPDAPLAYSPLPVINLHLGLPYEAFNEAGVVALPQFYTAELGPQYGLEMLMALWEHGQREWRSPAPAIYPTLQGYGQMPVEELRRQAQVCQETYGGYSVFRWGTMTPSLWEAIR